MAAAPDTVSARRSLAPAVIEGLAGANSRSPAGGFADLRNAYAAANTNSAFDGQRRYTVALLARAALATASTVNRS